MGTWWERFYGSVETGLTYGPGVAKPLPARVAAALENPRSPFPWTPYVWRRYPETRSGREDFGEVLEALADGSLLRAPFGPRRIQLSVPWKPAHHWPGSSLLVRPLADGTWAWEMYGWYWCVHLGGSESLGHDLDEAQAKDAVRAGFDVHPVWSFAGELPATDGARLLACTKRAKTALVVLEGKEKLGVRRSRVVLVPDRLSLVERSAAPSGGG